MSNTPPLGQNLTESNPASPEKRSSIQGKNVRSRVKETRNKIAGIEKQKNIVPPIYTIDISKGWDTESQVTIFRKGLKKLPFYRPGLLYSGFDGDKIGVTFHSECGEGVVFCNYEEVMGDLTELDNPFEYADRYDNPAIAVYNPEKLKRGRHGLDCEYIIDSPEALIAIIKF